jgi:hypothetical protein
MRGVKNLYRAVQLTLWGVGLDMWDLFVNNVLVARVCKANNGELVVTERYSKLRLNPELIQRACTE